MFFWFVFLLNFWFVFYMSVVFLSHRLGLPAQEHHCQHQGLAVWEERGHYFTRDCLVICLHSHRWRWQWGRGLSHLECSKLAKIPVVFSRSNIRGIDSKLVSSCSLDPISPNRPRSRQWPNADPLQLRSDWKLLAATAENFKICKTKQIWQESTIKKQTRISHNVCWAMCDVMILHRHSLAPRWRKPQRFRT